MVAKYSLSQNEFKTAIIDSIAKFTEGLLHSNRGCCRYQTWICGYVQRALGTARVWSGLVQEQRVHGGEAKIYTDVYISRES